MLRRPTLRLAPLLAIVLTTAACAPGVQESSDASTRPPAEANELSALERTAWEAWLLMEVGRLRTGAYSTQSLVDLALPQGIRWTVVDFGPDAYALSVSGDDADGSVRVTPDGVASSR